MGRRNGICQRTCDPTRQGCPFPSLFSPPLSPSSLPNPSNPSRPSVILLIPPLVLPVPSAESSHVVGHRHNSRLNCKSMMPGRHPFPSSMLAHARLPSASWSLDSDEALRSERRSHLASRPAFGKCKPISNKHTHSPWVFAHAIGTAVQSTHQQVPTAHRFAPRAKTRFIPTALESKAPGCETTRTHGKHHKQDRNPGPTAPAVEPKQAGTRPPQSGCPKQRHGFVLAKRPHPRAPCTAISCPATHSLERITAWLKCLGLLIREAANVIGTKSHSLNLTSCLGTHSHALKPWHW